MSAAPLSEPIASTACLGAHPAPSLREAAWQAWCEDDPAAKAAAALALAPMLHGESVYALGTQSPDALRPGRPARPRLVHPREVPQRGVGSEEGRAALLHAIAHIEFNAIDLALDAVWRFDDQPVQWYLDWASVAIDEARHFRLIANEMARRGWHYGDFDAHDGLWEMAMRTCHDPLARMGLVPRLMEARGLDVTPGMIKRLAQVGDSAAVAILEVILAEEVRHVRLGNEWYGRLCRARGLDPVSHWPVLARDHGVQWPHGPFNRAARVQAGFTDAELDGWLNARARIDL